MSKTPDKPRPAGGYLFVVAAATLWGIGGPLIRVLHGQGLAPMAIILHRVLISGITLLLYLVLGPRRLLALKRADLPTFLAAAVSGPGLSQPLFVYTVTTMPAALAALLNYTSPAFTVILAAAFLRERLTGRKLVALLLSVTGLCLVLGARAAGATDALPARAVLAGLASAFFYAIHTIILKKISQAYHALTMHLWIMSLGLPLIIAYNFLFQGGLPGLPPASATLPLLAVGLGPGLVAFLLYIKGLSRVQAGRASIVATWEPITAAVVGRLLLNELLSPLQIVGMLLTLAGVVAAALNSQVKRIRLRLRESR